MKNYIALTALALILLAPGYAHAQSTSAVSRTSTVVERAAQEQGFEANGGAAPSSSYVVPSLSTMAPVAPEASASSVTPSFAPAPAGAARPGLVTNNGLPKGLVMNGPGTEEYKKKHRKKKKKAAAAAPVAPVESAPTESSNFAAPAPTPEAATAIETPAPAPAPTPVAPAPEAAPPADIPPVPAAADPAMPAPSADPSTDPTPGELGPGGIEPPAPLTP